MAKIKRGGFIFVNWKSDHAPRHVHVYRDGKLVVKWDLENSKAMKGESNDKILKIIDELESEGRL